MTIDLPHIISHLMLLFAKVNDSAETKTVRTVMMISKTLSILCTDYLLCCCHTGMDSRYFDWYDPPPDVTLLDLDTNSVTVCV